MRTSPLFFLSAVVLVGATASAAHGQAVRTLSKADAEYAEPFTQIASVRELRDGRVIVADPREKTLQLVDLKSGSAQKISREGQGPGEYSLPLRLSALAGDTTLVYDPLNQRFLIIDGNGKPGAFFRIEPEGPQGGPIRIGGITGARYVDARGRLYFQGAAFRPPTGGGPPQAADSAAIVRYDRAAKKSDTVAWVKLPKNNVQVSGGAGNMQVRVGGSNPFAAQDDWAVMPDGRIAVVRAADYRVDWYSPAGVKTAGPPIQFARIKVTEADKKAIRDQRARGGGGIAIVRTDGPEGRRSSAGAAPPNANIPEPTDWPEYKPPFLQQAAVATPNGELWVLRSRPATDQVPSYDVFDAAGKVVGKVVLPKSTRLVGFGNGTVYLARSDEDDLQYLQRYRMP